MIKYSETYLKDRKKAWTEGKKKPQLGLEAIMLKIQALEDAADEKEKAVK